MTSLSLTKISFLKLILLINFFLPTWNSIASPTGTLGFVILNALLCVLLLMYVVGKFDFRILEFNFVGKIFICISLLLALQILISSFINDKVVFSDIFELIRPLFYFLTFYYGYVLIKKEIVVLDDLVRMIIKYTMLTVILGLILLFFYSEFGSTIMGFYVKKSLLDSRRFVGTFMNPYDYALLITVCFSYYFSIYLSKGSLITLIKISILVLAMAISQSKNVFAAFVYSFLLTSFLYNFYIDREFLKYRVRNNFRLGFLLLLILSAFFFIYINFGSELTYLINGIEKIASGNSDKSTSIRVNQLSILFEKLSDSPIRFLIGFGSNKMSELKFESLYSLYLFRYGVIGLLIIFFYSVVPFYLSAFRIRESGVSPTICLVLSVFFSSVLVAGVGNNIVDQARISLPFFLLFGAVTAQSSKKVCSRRGLGI